MRLQSHRFPVSGGGLCRDSTALIHPAWSIPNHLKAHPHEPRVAHVRFSVLPPNLSKWYRLARPAMSRISKIRPGHPPSVAFFLIATAILAGGCHRPRSKSDGDTTTISDRSQLSQTLVGKRITIRGGLFRFKCGPGIQFEDGAVVCLVDIPQKSGLNDPYAEMYEKLVEATGTLRFGHDSTPLDETRPTQQQHDHYYLETEIAQLRVISNYYSSATESTAKSHLSALVGKRITIRGKLQDFGFPVCLAIQLDDEEVVCLEDRRTHPYPGMIEKRVEATGTLRFFHDPTVMDENMPGPRVPDHYYFETETTQVRLITN
jgi:hypothetical protein